MPVPGSVLSLHAVVLLLLPLLTLAQSVDDHLLAQVLFCQPTDPASGLLKMFDEDQMFSYNFMDRSTAPWMQEFDKWTGQAFPSATTISFYADLCKNSLQNFTSRMKNIMPEDRGATQVSVFPTHPLSIGVPNTLVCAISDVFPPALTITWRKNGAVLSRELNSYGYFALVDLTFQAFSYLNATPQYEDTFSCDVEVSGDNRTLVGYWVPDYPVPEDILEISLCVTALAFGILFLFIGFMFLYFAKKTGEYW